MDTLATPGDGDDAATTPAASARIEERRRLYEGLVGGAIGGRYERAAGPLEPSHRRVRVEQHHEPVTEGTRRAQRRDVTGVQEVEASARRDDGRLPCAAPERCTR